MDTVERYSRLRAVVGWVILALVLGLVFRSSPQLTSADLALIAKYQEHYQAPEGFLHGYVVRRRKRSVLVSLFVEPPSVKEILEAGLRPL